LKTICNTSRSFGDDHVRWAKLHGIKVIKRFGRFWATFKVSCQKLKDNRCSIYDSRPEMCKEFKCEKFNGGKNGKDSST